MMREEGGSAAESHPAHGDLHDRGGGLHRIPTLREADGGDPPHRVRGERLQRRDQAHLGAGPPGRAAPAASPDTPGSVESTSTASTSSTTPGSGSSSGCPMWCCSENNKRLTHFSTCKVYGTIIRSVLPKDHP
ncbi:unnamed protein product [Musa acuminata var. zebrina]